MYALSTVVTQWTLASRLWIPTPTRQRHHLQLTLTPVHLRTRQPTATNQRLLLRTAMVIADARDPGLAVQIATAATEVPDDPRLQARTHVVALLRRPEDLLTHLRYLNHSTIFGIAYQPFPHLIGTYADSGAWCFWLEHSHRREATGRRVLSVWARRESDYRVRCQSKLICCMECYTLPSLKRSSFPSVDWPLAWLWLHQNGRSRRSHGLHRKAKRNCKPCLPFQCDIACGSDYKSMFRKSTAVGSVWTTPSLNALTLRLRESIWVLVGSPIDTADRVDTKVVGATVIVTTTQEAAVDATVTVILTDATLIGTGTGETAIATATVIVIGAAKGPPAHHPDAVGAIPEALRGRRARPRTTLQVNEALPGGSPFSLPHDKCFIEARPLSLNWRVDTISTSVKRKRNKNKVKVKVIFFSMRASSSWKRKFKIPQKRNFKSPNAFLLRRLLSSPVIVQACAEATAVPLFVPRGLQDIHPMLKTDDSPSVDQDQFSARQERLRSTMSSHAR